MSDVVRGFVPQKVRKEEERSLSTAIGSELY